MAAFKDKKSGTWYVQFRYTDWRGERQQKLKRGFATKREALEWERQFLMQKRADVSMTFESFAALYEKDVKPRLKLNTWLCKEHVIQSKILPYFSKRKLSDIAARDVIDWQNEMRQQRSNLANKTIVDKNSTVTAAARCVSSESRTANHIHRTICGWFIHSLAAFLIMLCDTTVCRAIRQRKLEIWEASRQRKCSSGQKKNT